ncbi:MAG: SURF1 family protein [Pseudomonadota bacterium]
MNPLKRPVLSVAVALAVGVLLVLGTWQVQRLQWKLDLIKTVEARMESAPMSLSDVMALPYEEREWRPVAFMAEKAGERVAHVAGTYEGQPGFYVFTLVQIPSGGELPVNHGFVGRDARASDYDLGLPARIEGLYRPSRPLKGLAAAIAAPADPEKGTFYTRNPDELLAWLFQSDAPPEPFYIARTDNAEVGNIPLGGTTRIEFSNNHLGYALTWYGLALGLILIYGLMMRSNRQPSP